MRKFLTIVLLFLGIQNFATANNLEFSNYKANTLPITKEQAISAYYPHSYAENTPEKIKAYEYLLSNNTLSHQDKAKIIANANKYSDSFFNAISMGIIPSKIALRYKVCENEKIMDSLIEIYKLLENNNFSQQELDKLVYIYRENLFADKEIVNIQDVKNIITNSQITQNEKFYYIYAKIMEKHFNSSDVKNDIIESYKLLKKHPQIVKNEFDETVFNDAIFTVLNHYPKDCKTKITIQKALDIPDISDKQRFYTIISLINSTNTPHSKIYDKIAETGLLKGNFTNQEEINPFLNDEVVLKDVLGATELLMKNGYPDWPLVRYDIFTIAPELHITTEVIKNVLADNLIPVAHKEASIAANLYTKKYSIPAKESDFVYEIFKNGYFNTFVFESDLRNLKYSGENLHKKLTCIDLMKRNGFSNDVIEKLLYSIKDNHLLDNDYSILYDIVKLVTSNPQISKEEMPDKIFVEAILNGNYKYEGNWEDNIRTLSNNGLINIEMAYARQYSDFKKFKDIDKKNIDTLIMLKDVDGFTREDILFFISYYGIDYFNFLAESYQKVMSDPSIRVVDRPAFVYTLAAREYQRNNIKEYSSEFENRKYAVFDEAIIDTYLNEGVMPYYKTNDRDMIDITKMFVYMRDKQHWSGTDISGIIEKSTGSSFYTEDERISATLKAVKKNKITQEQVESKIKQANAIGESKEAVGTCFKKAPGFIFGAITFPIWGPLLALFWWLY